MQLRECKVMHKETDLRFRCNIYAADMCFVRAISAVGSGTAIRALAAGLRSKEKVLFHAPGIHSYYLSADDKYTFRYAHLDVDTWQLTAMTTDPRFLFHSTDNELWRLLSSDEFTTPILRSWLPFIRHTLRRETHLLKTVEHSLGCDPVICRAEDKHLDLIVSAGIKSGKLKLE